jgi:CDP-diacylglycerol---glycerol-3-phosphate 3-phosphatidyltransferase
MAKLENMRRSIGDRLAPPMARLLINTPLTPNAVTWIGFFVTAGAAALIATRHFFMAGIVVVVAGAFDMLDGALARVKGQVTKFGAVLDSTLDRLCEAMLLLALIYIYARDGQPYWSLVAGVALVCSLMVSYLRARMEGLGIECKAGFFTRPERVILIALGLLLSHFHYVLLGAVVLLAAFSFYTMIERLVYAWRHLQE